MSSKVVSNSGPLIWLARSNTLQLLKKLYNTIFIPKAVFAEVVTEGIKRGYPDAPVIKKAVNQGWIKVFTPSKKMLSQVKLIEVKLAVQLGKGEREALGLALDVKGTVLTNDQVAATVAKSLGLDAKGTLFLLLQGVQNGLLSKDKIRNVMQIMLRQGFWLSPDHVQRFYEALQQIKQKQKT